MANATSQAPPAGAAPLPDAKQKRDQAAKARADAAKKADDLAFKQATQGVPDKETGEKILAWGGDATRASPAMEQNLGDPPLGVTTTTGAYRTPIDPTTAAAPLKADEVNPQAPKGFPTVGSGRKSGTPEKLYEKPEHKTDAPASSHT